MLLEQKIRDALSARATHEGATEQAWEAIQRRIDRRASGKRAVQGIAVVSLFAVAVVGVAGIGQRSRERTLQLAPAPPTAVTSETVAAPPPALDVPLPQGEPRALVAAAGSVWAVVADHDGSGSGTLVRIDQTTGETAATVAIDAVPGWEVGGDGIATSPGAIWLAGQTTDASKGPTALLQRVDTATNSVSVTLQLPGTSAADVIVVDGIVWVSLFVEDGKVGVVALDVDSRSVLATIPVAGSWIRELAYSDGVIIVHSRDARRYITAIDEQTRSPVKTVVAPMDALSADGSGKRGPVWVVHGGRLGLLDTQTLKVRLDDSIEVASSTIVHPLDSNLLFLAASDEAAPRGKLHLYNGEETIAQSTPDGEVIAITAAAGRAWVLLYDGRLAGVPIGAKP